MSDATITALREALDLTPNNLPLRRHLAETLLGLARYGEAADVCREGLSHTPGESSLEFLLADAFQRNGRNAEALVVLESLCARGAQPKAHLLRARLLLRTNETDSARRAYRKATEDDPQLEDAELSERLAVYKGEWREDIGSERLPVAEGTPRDETESKRLERPKIAFADVGGMEAVKDQVRKKIILPLKNPEIYKAYGKAVGGGILLYGPPGCGKTHIARATAGEVNASFISVGINDVLNMWIGESEKNLHELFEQARGNAPCILFFDEVDALGASRSDMRQSAGRQLINQFLSELDGIGAGNDGVLILAATNAPWHIDSAFRRPGRFDRIIFVPPPDESARESILRILVRGKPVEDIDFAALARKAKDFSGADLKACVDAAIEDKLESSLESGIPQPVGTRDLTKAIKAHKLTTREWFATARNYALFSNQGGHYDEILNYLGLK